MSTIREQITEYIKSTYDVVCERPWEKSPENETFKDAQGMKWFAICMRVKKKVLGLGGDEWIEIMNVKVEPDFTMVAYSMDGILPAYHMNKEHWITICLDGTVEMNTIKSLIKMSYDIVTDTPTKRIYEAVKKIPYGKVATYRQVAELAGNPKMARAVGNALHKNPSPDTIPCFRVVNAKGELAGEFAFGGAEVQANLLREEGVEVIDGKVDLSRFMM